MTDDDWGQPSLYGRGLITVEPRLFTEADPVPAAVVPAWQQIADEDWAPVTLVHPQWSPATYSGPRRHRPDDLAPEPPEDAAGHPPVVETNRQVLASSRTMAVAALMGRITGFLRNILLVAALGVGLVGDAYNGANGFPNMIYELLLGGAMTSIMVPLLVRAQEQDRDRGEGYTQRLLSIATASLGAATVLAVAASPLIAALFVSNHAQRGLTTAFAALLLPQIFFYALTGIFVAVLNVRQVYGPGAWAPFVNNVVVIATVAVFFALPGPKTLTPSSITTAQILVIGIGTTLGIAAQAIFLLPYLRRSGFRWRWRFRARPNEAGRLREDGALTLWVLAYVVASQVGVVVVTRVGYHVPNGGVTLFTNADLLFSVPQGVLVVSLLTALMPRMSRAAARGETAAVIGDLSLGGRLSAIALVPLTGAFIALGPVFTTCLFAYGQTPIEGARLIGISLAWSAFGLLPFAVVMLQLRVFYAMRDARTPTWINVAMVTVRVIIVLGAQALFHDRQRLVIALNFSTSASFVVGAILGYLVLSRRFGHLGLRPLATTVGRIAVPAAVATGVAITVVWLVRDLLGTGRSAAAVGLVVGGLGFVGVFLAIASQMNLLEFKELLSGVRPGNPRTPGMVDRNEKRGRPK